MKGKGERFVTYIFLNKGYTTNIACYLESNKNIIKSFIDMMVVLTKLC